MVTLKVSSFSIGKKSPLTVICGPCVMEGEKFLLECAKELKTTFAEFDEYQFIFKSSFDKANRSSLYSFRGPGMEAGLAMLQKVKEVHQIPVITDIHLPEEAAPTGQVCDLIQIPALLSRQTDLIVAAAKTQKPVHVKKGQFMSPWELKNVIEKITASGNQQVLVTDRGSCMGYQNLVFDPRSIPIMASFGFPVGLDASHCTQLSGKEGKESGGNKQYIPYLAKAALAVGVDVLYLEVHPHPEKAKSDRPIQLNFAELKALLQDLKPLAQLRMKENP